MNFEFMNAEFQLRLQSYLDGELSPAEAGAVETVLARDAEARALLAELRQTSSALAVFEADQKLPESREFYWSKIQRALAHADQPRTTTSRDGVPWWRRILIPAGGFAALVIAALLAFRPGSVSPQIETYLADSGALTYRDEAEKMTVVWLSYPAENDFANLKPNDTID